MRITSSGKIGIGTATIPSGYKFVVDGGKAGFREVFVKLTGAWPDYVFKKDYRLKSLSETESFYLKHHRLPGTPAATEVISTGQNLGEIQRLQQEKIEELFLYAVEMEKVLKVIIDENKKLKSEIEKLKVQQQ